VDLTASSGELGAAAGTTNIRIGFTNRSRSACVLLGHPRVAGVSPDGAVTRLDAAHGSIVGDDPWPAANISPRQTDAVNLSGGDGCNAAQRGQKRIYPKLRITLPSGDHLDVSSHGFDTACGVSVSRFGVPADSQPPDDPAPSPLTAHLSVPSTVRAGENVSYTVTLRNHGDKPYRLTPCPAYQEYVVLGAVFIHPNYHLNCDTIREIPAGDAITYQMVLNFPADLGAGQAKFGWQMQGEVGPAVAVLVQVTN
jgi:hypothetical protein